MIDAPTMRHLFLPRGYMWVGFDESGKAIAASILNEKPAPKRDGVFDGCLTILLCETGGKSPFGLHLSQIKEIE